MLIELEEDGAGKGVVSCPVLVNPASVAVVHATYRPDHTHIIFDNGFKLCVVGRCEDISRQIQEALGHA